MKLIVSKIIPKTVMFIALVCLLISCERDEAELKPMFNWTAETIEWGGDWTSLKDYRHFEIDL